jgi:FixJ family two-component response regulator
MVFVVDDDGSVRKALTRLIGSAGIKVESFASAEAFLLRQQYEGPCCLVLDIRMPGLSGLDLQAELAKANLKLPIIFMTGHGTVPMSVRAMKAGAVDFLEKPFEDRAILELIIHALERDRQAKQENAKKGGILERFESLTPREQDVLALVVTGKLNKQVALQLGISEKTVKVHRARVMEKMQAESLADLVRVSGILPIPKTSLHRTKVQ